MTIYIGLDLHSKRTVYVAQDEEGRTLSSGGVETSSEGLVGLLEDLDAAGGTEVAMESGNYGSTQEAIASVAGSDSDNDGYSNLVEITDTANFGNTPTFPGLSAGNLGGVLNVDPADLTVSVVIDILRRAPVCDDVATPTNPAASYVPWRMAGTKRFTPER